MEENFFSQRTSPHTGLLSTTSMQCLPIRNIPQRDNGGGQSVRRAAMFGSPLGMVTGNAAASQYLRDEHFQDKLFSVIVEALTSLFQMNCLEELAPSLLEAFGKLLVNHFINPATSRLRELVPNIGNFFTRLPFAEAFAIYDKKYNITRRLYVPPTFHEIRHTMNIAQIMAVRSQLRLITFDGDETLYPDGKNFDDNTTADFITTLLQNGIIVAVVTAAGYGYQVEKYEERLYGLFNYFRSRVLKESELRRFYVFGGESNYLVQCRADYRLHVVPESLWRSHVSERLKPFFYDGLYSEVTRLLSIAYNSLEDTAEQLSLRTLIIRKERAVGMVPGGPQSLNLRPKGSGKNNIKPEILEETVYRVRAAISAADPPLTIPYCAFNGGHDVWVDVGNKAEDQCLHIGDQFSFSGNDLAARDVCPTLWICNPSETRAVLRSLLRQMSQDSEIQSDDEDSQ